MNLFIFGVTVFSLIEFLIILTAWHNTAGGSPWRTLPRYMMPAFPLIIIYGYIGFDRLKKFRHSLYILIISLIPLSFLSKSYIHSILIHFLDIIKHNEFIMFIDKCLYSVIGFKNFLCF